MTIRVLFYTQHLLGIGHLVRSLRIAGALVASGYEVELVIGGMPVAGLDAPGARVLQLPPLAAGPDGFTALVTADGAIPGEAYMAARRDLLHGALERLRPDVLLVEAFPFARRMLRTEIVPLIVAARNHRPRPLIVSSVRDILQRNPRVERRRESAQIVEQLFDAVIVHGEPTFATLDETFPEVSSFARLVHYSGFVGPSLGDVDIPAPADVVVSAGGGAVGFALLEAAIAAKSRTTLADARWIVVTGPRMAPELREQLMSAGAAQGCRVVPFLADLPVWFRYATVAVSQAGYNTVADLMAARCRSVLVPFADGGETEQSERARRLSERRMAIALDPSDLAVATLAAAIDAARQLPSLPEAIALDGARRTAVILADLRRCQFA